MKKFSDHGVNPVRNSSPAIAGIETDRGTRRASAGAAGQTPPELFWDLIPPQAELQSPAPHGVQGRAAGHHF